jgi:hypothetical protein
LHTSLEKDIGPNEMVKYNRTPKHLYASTLNASSNDEVFYPISLSDLGLVSNKPDKM